MRNLVLVFVFIFGGCSRARTGTRNGENQITQEQKLSSNDSTHYEDVDAFAFEAAEKLLNFFQKGFGVPSLSPEVHASVSLLIQGGLDHGKTKLVKDAFTSLDLDSAEFPNKRVDAFFTGLLWIQAPKVMEDVKYETEAIKYLSMAKDGTASSNADIANNFKIIVMRTVAIQEINSLSNAYLAYLFTQWVVDSDKVSTKIKHNTIAAFEMLTRQVDLATTPESIASNIYKYINAGWLAILGSTPPIRVGEIKVHIRKYFAYFFFYGKHVKIFS